LPKYLVDDGLTVYRDVKGLSHQGIVPRFFPQIVGVVAVRPRFQVTVDRA
jgi:hypothetical protein